MSDLKKQLIKLGSTNPELRHHIREVLSRIAIEPQVRLVLYVYHAPLVPDQKYGDPSRVPGVELKIVESNQQTPLNKPIDYGGILGVAEKFAKGKGNVVIAVQIASTTFVRGFRFTGPSLKEGKFKGGPILGEWSVWDNKWKTYPPESGIPKNLSQDEKVAFWAMQSGHGDNLTKDLDKGFDDHFWRNVSSPMLGGSGFIWELQLALSEMRKERGIVSVDTQEMAYEIYARSPKKFLTDMYKAHGNGKVLYGDDLKILQRWLKKNIDAKFLAPKQRD